MYDAYEIPRARLTKQHKRAAHWKTCTWCQQKLPLSAEFFHRDKGQKDGLKSRCKVCTRILAQMNRPIVEREIPRMTPAEHARIDALQAADQLKGRIRVAARKAKNAAAGIVLTAWGDLCGREPTAQPATRPTMRPVDDANAKHVFVEPGEFERKPDKPGTGAAIPPVKPTEWSRLGPDRGVT